MVQDVAHLAVQPGENGLTHVIAVDLEQEGSLLVYGTSGAGKTTLLRTLAVAFAERNATDDLHVYGLDFATRGLTPLEVKEIYAVREELEVMAARIIPFPVAATDIARLEELQRQHARAIADGEMLTVFYSNLRFHQVLYGLCGNACLIETIDLLAQKVYGIRSYANASPQVLERMRRDHVDMIRALRAARREELIALTRRHLKPQPEAYIRAYERRFGRTAADQTI